MELYVDIEKQLGRFHLRAKLTAGCETLALLGTSGCGKSMTLKCIAGIERPDRGKIILDGVTLFDSEKHIDLPPQKRRVGYLFQQYALFPNMSAEKNVLCALHALPRAERGKVCAELFRRFRLEGLEKKLPSQLSGGQQQRVALARILAARPKAILLDEPFSALDAFLKWKLEAELTDLLSDFKGPVLWVSHDLGECRRNCTRVCAMDAGKTGRLMALEELLAHPDSVSEARLAGYQNFFPASAAANGLELPQWGLCLAGVQAPEQTRTLCVPPAAIDLSGNELRLSVLRIIPDVSCRIALLRPASAQAEAEPLRVELPPDSAVCQGQSLQLSLRPQALLFL